MEVPEDHKVDFNLLLKSEILDVASQDDVEQTCNVKQEPDFQEETAANNPDDTFFDSRVDIKSEILPPDFEVKRELQVGEDEVLDNILPRYLENTLKESLNDCETGELCVGRSDTSPGELTSDQYPRLPKKTRGSKSDKLHKCNVCGKKFSKKSSLQQHLQVHVAERDNIENPLSNAYILWLANEPSCNSNSNSCIIANCDSNPSLTDLPGNGLKDKIFKCSDCGTDFNSKVQLINHKKKHSKEFQCTKCDLAFVSRSLLSEHNLEKHTKGNTQLVSHKEIRSGEKPYQGENCDAPLSTANGLKRNPVETPTKAAYTDAGALKLHQTKECSKKSCDASHIKNHQTKKSKKERHFNSSDVDLNSPSNDDSNSPLNDEDSHSPLNHADLHSLSNDEDSNSPLNDEDSHSPLNDEDSHSRLDNSLLKCKKKTISKHTSENNQLKGSPSLQRPYQCKFCPTAFSTSASLKKHIDKAHAVAVETPLQCQACSDVFPDMDSLSFHKRKLCLKKPFRCKRCEASYFHYTSLRRHEMEHSSSEGTPYKCKLCGASFLKLNDIIRHQKKKHTEKKPYKCTLCDAAFVDSIALRKHQDKQHSVGKHVVNDNDEKIRFTPKPNEVVDSENHCGENNNLCDNPSSDSVPTSALDANQKKTKSETRSKDFKCSFCDSSFAKRSNLVVHMRMHTGDMPFKCNVCSATFARRNRLAMHQRTHTGERIYKCAICKATYYDKGILKKHQESHFEETPHAHKCDVCSEAFTSLTLLSLHKGTQHQTESVTPEVSISNSSAAVTAGAARKWRCCDCNLEFPHRNNFNSHVKSHLHLRPYECDTCSANFQRNQHLIVHKRTHTGERPFKCKICSAAYMSVATLRVHEKSHGPVRPYACKFCDRRFYTHGLKTQHEKQHTTGKPFKCEICSSAYNVKSQLVTHMRKHTGERPFKCLLCNASYMAKVGLKKHLVSHLGERPFKCDACDASYQDKRFLYYHQLTHTGEKPYQCHTCGKMYNNLMSLHAHIKSHSRELLHCDKCSKEFTSSFYLAIHKKKGCHLAAMQLT